jgi:hypothetical protein
MDYRNRGASAPAAAGTDNSRNSWIAAGLAFAMAFFLVVLLVRKRRRYDKIS